MKQTVAVMAIIVALLLMVSGYIVAPVSYTHLFLRWICVRCSSESSSLKNRS